VTTQGHQRSFIVIPAKMPRQTGQKRQHNAAGHAGSSLPRIMLDYCIPKAGKTFKFTVILFFLIRPTYLCV